MRIAVFGSDGQLGTDVVDALDGHDVVPFVESSLDITDSAAVSEALSSEKPDRVINCAAMTDVDGCETRVARAVEVNGAGARNIAAACHASGAALLHISTDYVFDGRKQGAYVETDPTRPVNVYGMSKLMGEWFVEDACPSHYIVRTSGLYGHNPCIGKGTNFVETMLRLGRERESLKVVSDEVLTPTFTVDLARQLRALIDTEPPFGVYHATNDGSCSWHEFAVAIFGMADVQVDVSPIPASEWAAPTRRPANSVLANDALRAQGCDRMPPWEDALRRYIETRPA